MDNSKLELPTNKKFGLFFSAIFLCLSLYFIPSKLGIYFLILSAILAIITFLKAEILLPFNKCWMYIGIFLGRVISPIVLGLIFFGLFAPISLLTRLFGRDELSLKMKKQDSYWKVRKANFLESDTFKFQF